MFHLVQSGDFHVCLHSITVGLLGACSVTYLDMKNLTISCPRLGGEGGYRSGKNEICFTGSDMTTPYHQMTLTVGDKKEKRATK